MATVTIGSLLGVVLQQLLPANMQAILFQAIGLGSVLIGIKMMLKLPEGYMLHLMFALIIGSLIGEAIHLDEGMNNLSEVLKSFLGIGDEGFTEGLVTAFILFCVGSMTVVGSIEEGVQGKRELVYVKSILDGFSSIALASTFGIGVLFSIIPMLFVQGGITLGARIIQHRLNDILIDCVSAVGGTLIIGIAIKLLNHGDISLNNMLPSLVIISIMVPIYQRWKR